MGDTTISKLHSIVNNLDTASCETKKCSIRNGSLVPRLRGGASVRGYIMAKGMIA